MNDGYATSACTGTKDFHFRELLRTHIRVVKAIMRKYAWAQQTYFYWDLNSGPGIDDQRRVGSPIEFITLADEAELKYQAYFFEQNPKHAARLKELVSDNAIVVEGDHNDTLPQLLAAIGGTGNAYGLMYADPTGKIPPFDLIGEVTSHKQFARIDQLIYVSSANIKRGLMAHPGSIRRLNEYLTLINKKFWIIREPQAKHQWTFLLGTNWTDFPEFEAIGFYRMDTERGKEILHRLSTTNKERIEDGESRCVSALY